MKDWGGVYSMCLKLMRYRQNWMNLCFVRSSAIAELTFMEALSGEDRLIMKHIFIQYYL